MATAGRSLVFRAGCQNLLRSTSRRQAVTFPPCKPQGRPEDGGWMPQVRHRNNDVSVAAEVKWAEGAAAPTGAASHDGMGLFVNSHYDSGNIEVIDIHDLHTFGTIQMRIHEDPHCEVDGRCHMQWFYYRVTGAKGEQLEMKITNAGEASYPSAWHGYNACASYDRKYWFRVPTSYEADTGVLTIRHTPERDAVCYAYFAPYPYERHQELIADMQNSDIVHLEMLGESLDGHDLDLLRIGEPGEGKRNIWVIARQHPGESMAEWFAEGLLKRLVDPLDATSRALLQQAVFYVVPNMNPDGTWRGHLRTNAAGANLNREWANPDEYRSPEVWLVRNKMDVTGVDMFVDVHGDEELPYNFIAGNEGIPGWTDRLADLQASFAQAFVRASPDFQTGHGYGVDAPGAANMATASSAVGQKHDCLSVTLEMPFKDTCDMPEPQQGWSPERSMKLGAAMLNAVLETVPKLR